MVYLLVKSGYLVKVAREQLLIHGEIRDALASLLAVPQRDLRLSSPDGYGAAALLHWDQHTFVVELLKAASPGTISEHGNRLAAAAKRAGKKAIPLLGVAYMTEAGRRLCAAAHLSWFDLSGNSRIIAPGLRVIVDGRPNRFRGRGRPASIFAPKSARVVRWLLEHSAKPLTQRQIAHATEMTEGFVSRIVSRLLQESYVVRETSGALRLKNSDVLLDAWCDEYDFSKHTILHGHVAARSGDALVRFVSDTLSSSSVEYAATGLAAAWQMNHFASFRTATFFLSSQPSDELRTALSFRDDPRGANLWLVVPNDRGVLHGATDYDGVRCVHPVQAYIDLKAHPERAPEAADRLRKDLFAGGRASLPKRASEYMDEQVELVRGVR
ncbi:MAG: hypothetical protein IT381_00010 [Deltaproteobacteria bacterium]|nr:hypothetical protein [Deltaproteobacteria bacterium]